MPLMTFALFSCFLGAVPPVCHYAGEMPSAEICQKDAAFQNMHVTPGYRLVCAKQDTSGWTPAN